MEAFSDWLALASAQPVPSAVVLALTLFALSVFLRPRDPPPIRYSVSVPEQCKPGWRGKELAEPSLKVRSIQWKIVWLSGVLYGLKLSADTCEQNRFLVHRSSNAMPPRPERTWVLSIRALLRESTARLKKRKRRRWNGPRRALRSGDACCVAC